MSKSELNPAVREVFQTQGEHHFFGYYDKSLWNQDGNLLLAHETDVVDRLPGPDDAAKICVYDFSGVNGQMSNVSAEGGSASGGNCRALAESRAWNFQQGAMLQWLGPDFNSKIIFNDLQDGKFVSVIIDIASGQKEVMPFPVYAVHPSGKYALSVDFSLLNEVREGYGYKGAQILSEELVYSFKLEENASKQILIRDELLHGRPLGHADLNGRHWIDHLTFNPSGNYFAFLHRQPLKGGGFHSQLYYATSDAGAIVKGPELLLDSGMASHFAWKNDDELIIWARPPGLASAVGKKSILRRIAAPIYHAFVRSAQMRQKLSGDALLLFNVRTRKFKKIGEGILTEDGHSTFSPDGKWILTDTYADKNHYRKLLLFNLESHKLFEVGRFYSLPEFSSAAHYVLPAKASATAGALAKEWDSSGMRADLHPRFNRDGTQVCIDSVHSGTRQMHIYDISNIVNNNQ